MLVREIIFTFLQIYELLILIRIFLSWFNVYDTYHDNPIINAIYILTEPFLDIFRRISFLRLGMVDFSPIFAIMILNVLKQMLLSGNLTFTSFLIYLILGIWSIARSILFIFIIIFTLRLIFLMLNLFNYTPLLMIIDTLLYSLCMKINSLITTKSLSYKVNLSIAVLLLIFLVYALDQIIKASIILLGLI